MANGSIGRRRVVTGIALWLCLYLGISVTLFAVFSVTRSAQPGGTSLATVAFALGVVITGLSFLAVIIDRLLFAREPTHFLTRQSVWVLVLAMLTVLATAIALRTISVTPGNAVLLGITVALPTTMLLFAAVNLARYRSMEYRP